MIIKKIDRYVSCAFLVRFLGSMTLIFGLYLSFDALKRIDQIQEVGLTRAAPMILRYYSYLLPAMLGHTGPPLLLLGAGMALVQMSRRRELLTLKAAGISIRRVTLPIFLLALPVAVSLFWVRESIVPLSIRQYELLERELGEKVVSSCLLNDPRHNFRLYVDEYSYATQEMFRLCVMRQYPSRALKTTIVADYGVWRQDGSIGLETVTIQNFDESGNPVGKPQVRPTMILETSLAPFDFVRAKEESLLPSLTLLELRLQARKNPNVPAFSVMLHSRLAEPFVPFVLLLVGIPLLVGFEHPTQSRVLGIVVCILVAGGFYVLSFVCVSLAKTGVVDPVLAAWFPTGLMGAAGLYLFTIMRT